MQDQTIPSLLENLPIELLAYILSFSTESERIEMFQQLSLVCKNLNQIVSSDFFLKAFAPPLYFRKEKKLLHLLDRQGVMAKQIEDWEALKNKIDDTFATFYNNLPSVKALKKLIDDLKNASLPASYYFSGFKTILSGTKRRIVFTILLVAIIAAVVYSACELPAVAPLKAQKSID